MYSVNRKESPPLKYSHLAALLNKMKTLDCALTRPHTDFSFCHGVVNFALCFGSLSCLKVNILPIDGFLAEISNLSDNIFIIFS